MKFHITKRDFYNAQWLHVKPRPFFAYIGIVLLILYGLVVIFGGYRAIERGDIRHLLFLFVPMVYLSASFSYRIYRIGKTYNQHKLLHDEIDISLDGEVIITKSNHGECRMSVIEIHKTKDDNKVMLLYHSDNMFQVIPKKSEELESLCAEIKILVGIAYIESLAKPKLQNNNQ